MNTALRERLTQFHHRYPQELTPVMTRLLRIWEQVEIERCVLSARGLAGRPRARGRPCKGEVRHPPKATRLERQATGMIPISALLTFASVRDSQVAIPPAAMSVWRVTRSI